MRCGSREVSVSVRSATAKTSANPVAVSLVQVVAADDGDDRYRRGAQCDGGGQLALQGLVVEPSFAGDDQVGVSDVAVEVQQVQEVLGAGGGGGAEQQGGEADAAGGTRARGVGAASGAREPGAGEGDDKVLEPGVEFVRPGLRWRPFGDRKRRRRRSVRAGDW